MAMKKIQRSVANKIRDMNIEARYQEAKDAVARTLNRETTLEILNLTKELHAWILQKLEERLLTL